MANSPAISVLMTAKDSQNYVGSAIESILGQTFSDFEFIIVDDGSRDKTPQIIESYRQKDRRIIFFKNDSSLGIAAGRNLLVERALGKYVAWQDSDDISLPSRLEKQFKFMESNPAVGICGGWLQFFSDDKPDLSLRKYQSADASLRRLIFKYSPVAQPATMIRRQALILTGPYDSSLSVAEDLDMSFRLGQKWQFANLPEVVIKYRQHSDSMTFRKLRELEKNTLKIRLKFMKDKNYHFAAVDFFYNLLQFSTLYLTPAKLRVKFFNLMRNR